MGLNHAERQLRELLDEHGAVLEQEHPHRKWRLPDGRSFTAPFSGSDVRGAKNALSDLRRFLGVSRESGGTPTAGKSEKGKGTARRRAKAIPSRETYGAGNLRPSLKEQLQALVGAS